MCLKGVENFQELSQIDELVVFNAVALWITFDACNANGSFPEE